MRFLKDFMITLVPCAAAVGIFAAIHRDTVAIYVNVGYMAIGVTGYCVIHRRLDRADD